MKPPIENIELIRKAKNLTREDVAKKLKVSLSNYGKIENGEIGLTIERLYELAKIFYMQPEDILMYNKSIKGNVTYVPVHAQAGFLSGYSQEYIDEFKTYNLPFIEGKNLFMIDANGDSMFPTIHHSDKIVIEQATDRINFKYGSIYVLITKEGRVIKRIQSSLENAKKIILKSDNEIYEPYQIFKNEIVSIWKVHDYVIRTNLTPRSIYKQNETIINLKEK